VIIIYNYENVRNVLMDLLRENNLSMRKLSKRTGIDPAVISKIVNGKRKANLNHLYKLAKSLDVPVASLIEAAGYQTESADHSASHDSLNLIHDFLRKSGDFVEEPTIELIEEKAAAYRDYSLTNEGMKTIFNHFKNKLDNIGGKGSYIQQLEMMFERFRLKKGTKKELMLMGSALIYFIFTMDVVPDYMFPIGYLDDALVVQMTLQSLSVEK